MVPEKLNKRVSFYKRVVKKQLTKIERLTEKEKKNPPTTIAAAVNIVEERIVVTQLCQRYKGIIAGLEEAIEILTEKE